MNNNLSEPLSPEELDKLDNFLLNRIDDEEDTEGKDEGIIDISSLDGLFTALASAPVVSPPSRWLPAIWGDFEPTWKDEKEFTVIFSLLMRYMNSIINHLENSPETYEPMFMSRDIDGKEILIVDDWCFAYMQGLELMPEYSFESIELQVLLNPIKTYGTEEGWDALDQLNTQEQDNIVKAITPNVREIFAYWSDKRVQEVITQTFKHDTPKVKRNDPCPCGSGKKYKKCCLH